MAFNNHQGTLATHGSMIHSGFIEKGYRFPAWGLVPGSLPDSFGGKIAD
tara:strand:+ start:8052 stop:8198 length:147 start_codon:yes stop_codon:yes gene_type:complete